jgi:hypothetical protein
MRHVAAGELGSPFLSFAGDLSPLENNSATQLAVGAPADAFMQGDSPFSAEHALPNANEAHKASARNAFQRLDFSHDETMAHREDMAKVEGFGNQHPLPSIQVHKTPMPTTRTTNHLNDNFSPAGHPAGKSMSPPSTCLGMDLPAALAVLPKRSKLASRSHSTPCGAPPANWPRLPAPCLLFPQSQGAAHPPLPRPPCGTVFTAGTQQADGLNMMQDRRAPCNCKKSRCLKLYCDCFAAGSYCNGCNCKECSNSPASEEARQEAVTATLARNPNAFRQKIKKAQAQAAAAAAQQGGGGVKHAVGCHCKKSKCLKKYCECYQGGISCGDKCKCIECRNFEGSPDVLAKQDKRSKSSRSSAASASAAAAAASFSTAAHPKHMSPGSGSSSESSYSASPISALNEKRSAAQAALAVSFEEPASKVHKTHSSAVTQYTGSHMSGLAASPCSPTSTELAEAQQHAGLDDEESRRIFGSDNTAVKKCVVIYTLHFLDNDDLYVTCWVLRCLCVFGDRC